MEYPLKLATNRLRQDRVHKRHEVICGFKESRISVMRFLPKLGKAGDDASRSDQCGSCGFF
jgi:hypothetical protein